MPRAVVLGGTGAIGRAVAERLLPLGWEVTLTGRDPAALPDHLAAAGARFHRAERGDAAAAHAALRPGADLLVDCLCFTAADARLHVDLARSVASSVMVSSKAVYVDAAGNHSNSDVPPDFGGPIPETQPTLPPDASGSYDSREGYGANKVAAERVVLDSGLPVTVLRASKIHGPGSRSPREWVFVKRILDGRPALVLARGGGAVEHPSAAANTAALIETVAARPGARVLNSADPDAPTVLEMARAVASHLGHSWQEVLLDGPPEGTLGLTPWDGPHPVVLDTRAALALGYVPAGTYAETVRATADWLVAAARGKAGADRPPAPDDPSFASFLDYAAEDALLDSLRRG